MKFGEYLLSQRCPGWEEWYLDYQALKNLIKALQDLNDNQNDDELTGLTSLTIPKASILSANLSHEDFFIMLEKEMKKIEAFTNSRVQQARIALASLENDIKETLTVSGLNEGDPKFQELTEGYHDVLKSIGDDFLNLEKFVNINFTGFHKILKKHDKHLPNPCRTFYTKRLQNQSWIRGDYSDVFVTMSKLYAILRRDKKAKVKDDAKQNFVRSTRKYWVHTEHISEVKYAILQHLPVFLQDTMEGDSDSQMTTSIYVDNFALELYRGRLEKSPGAIALRFRWYGPDEPNQTVFVERKTHRESWMGEVSVKERFSIREDQVLPLLQGKFNVNEEIDKLRRKGKKEEDIEEWHKLATEVIQAINSKQLVPTMRTQYTRTAFQIPFDATVRISLDTNLTMINERTKEALSGTRWYRNEREALISPHEITRFPHAILEIKLQLQDEASTPPWVTELLESGKLLEVHKFSKFIHGCAVLMPKDVYAVPYWVDDVTLKESILKSGGGELLVNEQDGGKGRGNRGAGFNTLLPHDEAGNVKQSYLHKTTETINPLLSKRKSETSNSLVLRSSVGSTKGRHSAHSLRDMDRDSVLRDDLEANKGHGIHSSCCSDCYENVNGCCNSCAMLCMDDCVHMFNGNDGEDTGWFSWAASSKASHITTQKVEPKLFFANERTFISWLQMSVMMTSISVTVSALAATDLATQSISLTLLPIALLFDLYALRVYFVRTQKIKIRSEERWDDAMGPVILGSLFLLALTAEFIIRAVDYAQS